MNERMYSLTPLPNKALLLNGRYQILWHINTGGSSFVYIAINKHGKKFIIKELVEQNSVYRDIKTLDLYVRDGYEQKFQQRKESFLLDATRLASVCSPYIVGVMDFFYEHNTAYIVMPHIIGSTLAEALRNHRQFSEYEVLSMTRDIANALVVLQSMDWVHSDIKPGNIFIRHSGSIFLLDFGSAFQKKRHSILEEQDDMRDVLATTKGYVSPELSLKGYVKYAGTWSDVFSLGRTMLIVIEKMSISPYIKDFFYQLANPMLKERRSITLEYIITTCSKMMVHANKYPTPL